MKNKLVTMFTAALAAAVLCACANPAQSLPGAGNGTGAEGSWAAVSAAADLVGVWSGDAAIEYAEGTFTLDMKLLVSKNDTQAGVYLTADNGSDRVYASDTVPVSFLLGDPTLLINAAKTKLKQKLGTYSLSDYGVYGFTIADAELVMDKVSARPASLIVMNGPDNGAGEYIIDIKILKAESDSGKELLGIGQKNAAYEDDKGGTLFIRTAGDIGRGEGQVFAVPGGKYVVKVSLYRGSFLGWLHCKSESFTIADGETVTVCCDYINYDETTKKMGLAVIR